MSDITEISGTIYLANGTTAGFIIMATPAGEPSVSVDYTGGTDVDQHWGVVDLILAATKSRFGIKP